MPFGEEFDAVFSNAVRHWIKQADSMIAGVYRSLKPGGSFLAECGGYGCVHKIRTARVHASDRRGIYGEDREPRYFPTPGDYATRLERASSRVDNQIAGLNCCSPPVDEMVVSGPGLNRSSRHH